MRHSGWRMDQSRGFVWGWEKECIGSTCVPDPISFSWPRPSPGPGLDLDLFIVWTSLNARNIAGLSPQWPTSDQVALWEIINDIFISILLVIWFMQPTLCWHGCILWTGKNWAISVFLHGEERDSFNHRELLYTMSGGPFVPISFWILQILYSQLLKDGNRSLTLAFSQHNLASVPNLNLGKQRRNLLTLAMLQIRNILLIISSSISAETNSTWIGP